jgi:hypothetical protein
MSVSKKLQEKYNLILEPSISQIKQWQDKTLEYQRQGFSKEDAGRAASRHIFAHLILEKRSFAVENQADDIDTILNMIGQS